MFCNYDQYKDKEVVKSMSNFKTTREKKDRVFSLEWNGENITLMECCDYCFGHDLTKRRVQRIIRGIPRVSRRAGEIKNSGNK